MHMGSVTAFKGPLRERLVYFHHQTARETEAQGGTGPESHLPKESRGVAGVKQVRSSTSSPERLPPRNFPQLVPRGHLMGLCVNKKKQELSSPTSFGIGDHSLYSTLLDLLQQGRHFLKLGSPGPGLWNLREQISRLENSGPLPIEAD